MAVSSLACGNHTGRVRIGTRIRARPRNSGGFLCLQPQPGAFRRSSGAGPETLGHLPYRDERWGTVLVVFPAVATTLFGLLIGKLLITSRSMASKAKVIGGLEAGFLISGFTLSPIIPIEMKMWTTSYGLASAGVACLEFLFFFWLVDIVRYRRWSIVFLPFGMNAIFIYMLTSLVSISAGTDVFTGPIAVHLGRGGLLFQAIGTMAVEWLILFWMMKRKIFIKA
jgi:predicted acyltransferase